MGVFVWFRPILLTISRYFVDWQGVISYAGFLFLYFAKAYASVATALRHIGRNVPMTSVINQGGTVGRKFQGTNHLRVEHESGTSNAFRL